MYIFVDKGVSSWWHQKSIDDDYFYCHARCYATRSGINDLATSAIKYVACFPGYIAIVFCIINVGKCRGFCVQDYQVTNLEMISPQKGKLLWPFGKLEVISIVRIDRNDQLLQFNYAILVNMVDLYHGILPILAVDKRR